MKQKKNFNSFWRKKILLGKKKTRPPGNKFNEEKPNFFQTLNLKMPPFLYAPLLLKKSPQF